MKRLSKAGRRLAAVTALGLAALAALAASTRPDSAAAVEALPGVEVSKADLKILVEAAKSCPSLTPARLAGQVMAASQFGSSPVTAVSAVGGRGTAGLTPQVWRKWTPWKGAEQSDKRASVIALAHGVCDLVGQLRVVKIPGDQWRLALAAHRVGMPAVIKEADVPAGAREYVDTVERYALWYSLQPDFGGSGDSAPAVAPVEPPVVEAPLVPVPEQYVAAVVAAGGFCEAVPPARIAAQIMATSGFDAQKLGPAGQQGIAQFLPQVWVKYVPPSSVTPWTADAAVRGLGSTMCAMVKERSKRDKQDAYPLALAAFQRGDSSVRTIADLKKSESLTSLVDLVVRYQAEYAKDTRLVAKPKSPSSAKPSKPSTKPEPVKPNNPSVSVRRDQPPVKASDGDGSGRVYGPYFIRNHGTGLCVDEPGTGAGMQDGGIYQNNCFPRTEDNQEFAFVPQGVDSKGNQLYWIRNIDDSFCLDLKGVGAPPSGAAVHGTLCLKNDNQEWRLEKSIIVGKVQRYWIINASSGLCLDLPGVATAGPDTQLLLSNCRLNDDNDWSLVQKSEW